jgi:hypothetical protein
VVDFLYTFVTNEYGFHTPIFIFILNVKLAFNRLQVTVINGLSIAVSIMVRHKIKVHLHMTLNKKKGSNLGAP